MITTKEYMVRLMLSAIEDDEGPLINPRLIEPFTKIIKESPTLDLIDAFVKSLGYDDIADFDDEWCEGHFDDGFYNYDIYKSEETFRTDIEDYAKCVIEPDTPHKNKRG